ncbi:hypothetical protein [Methylopila sp. Yamaguchi]|uniref:hypothetical protein n=1 Tax=Methylopila sp. Yamaguchi TaxID=1437817 RepID=UPI000CC2B127|nr:hypothetical protein [Methylopila sp. Yamaguchi]GBD47731.1 hypothetical protein METY_0944 [Methylopila sp. Yamaguchi]
MKFRTLATAVVVASVAAPTAQAGFLDFLFGRRAPAPVEEYREPRAAPPPAPRAERAPVRKPQLTPQEQLARTIDPVANPDWHLMDPTLRRGDVLFLADRVVVFTGGRIGDPSSYAPLESTHIVSSSERRALRQMAGRAAQDEPQEPKERRRRTIKPAGARLATSF